jgi:hypothetical protein
MKNVKVSIVGTVLATAWLGAATAHAAVVNFVFDPNSTLTLYSPNHVNATYQEALTGTFSFDAATDTVSAVDITMSGSVNASFLYSFSGLGSGSNAFGVSAAGYNNNGGVLAYLQFDDTLDGSVQPDPLLSGAIYNTEAGNLSDSSFTGGVSVVPEPATWALMLVGLGGMGAALRSRRQAPVEFRDA